MLKPRALWSQETDGLTAARSTRSPLRRLGLPTLTTLGVILGMGGTLAVDDSVANDHGPRVYPILGGSWFELTDSAMRARYGGGPGIGGGVGLTLRRRLAAEARVDWFRTSGHPPAPTFIDRSDSKLTLVPISGVLRYRFADGPDSFLLLIGPSLLLQAESFTYSLLESAGRASGHGASFGLSFGLGWEATRGALAYRLSARVLVSRSTRGVLRDGGPEFAGDDSVVPSLFAAGLEMRRP